MILSKIFLIGVNMSNYELDNHIADVLKKSRNDAGKTQEYLSEQLEVSRKTIENWENGSVSPSIKQFTKWFRVLGLDMVRYMNPILHPAGNFSMNLTQSAQEQKESMFSVINSMSEEEVRMLFFLMCGSYSGSSLCAMELCAAYLHLPLKDRICIAEHIILEYEIEEAKGKLDQVEFIKPDTRMVHIAIRKALEAVKGGEENYTSLMEE